MSIIQRIREKGALISAIVIALALLGFILMDAFAGRTGMMNGQVSSYVGKVNGEKIDRIEFERKIKDMESRYLAQGAQLDDNMRQQMMMQLWEQEVNQIVMEEEYEELGLDVTDKELRNFLLASPSAEIKQQFTDAQGNFNATTAQQSFNNAVLKDPVQKEGARNYFLSQKYMALLTGSIYIPKWVIEKRNADNALMAKFSYVSVPYSSIADSTVKVTDEDIKEYINDHKRDFEQKEETRGISFVMFSAAPSSADSAAIRTQVEELKPQFAAATDNGAFLARQGSTLPFFNGYVSKNAIQVPAKDSVLAQPTGVVYGPYLDGSNYVLSKIVDSRTLPDSVKCRHILLGTMNPQTGQPLMADSVAKAKADSIAAAIRNGASFDLLDSLYSTDEVAKREKGVMTFSSTDIQGENFAKEFGQFILFDGKPGDKKVVKTQFGWHYIEIMEHKNPQPHYKIAYMAKQILASAETDQDAHNQANQFAGDSRDLNSFNANYDKSLRTKGIQKLIANDIRPMDFSVNGIPAQARSFVKKIFEADKGDVLEPERVGDNYVVAIITEVNEPGLMSVTAARMYVEPLIRNRKKAEIIIRNIGQVTTLEQVATKTAQQIQTLDSVRFNGGELGYEPRVLGAAFNPANKGKVVNQPIEGISGVYVIRVENQATTPVEAANVEELRKLEEMQRKQAFMSQMQQGYNPFAQVLKESAKIVDNRAEFY